MFVLQEEFLYPHVLSMDMRNFKVHKEKAAVRSELRCLKDKHLIKCFRG